MLVEELNKLALLSKREREVLWLVCEGNSYKDISQKLYISVPTVKATMGHVYIKLGLDILQKAERIQAIHQVFWPLLKEAELPPEAPQAEIPIPVPEPVAQMVDEDEHAIIPYRPSPADIIEIRTPKPVIKKDTGKRIRNWLLMVVFLGLGVIACAAVAYFAFLQNQDRTQVGLELTKAVAQLTQVAEALASQPTMAAIPTQVIDQPAAAPTPEPIVVVVTATPPPATAVPTAIPAPAISLPFSDNFDNGSSSQWKVLSGKWITADGRFTIMGSDGWSLVALDDPTWKNYHISANINIPHQMAGAQGQIGIFVRTNSQPFMGFANNTISRAYWGIISQESHWLDGISGAGNYSVPSQYNLDLEVNGNTFIARINGQEVQRLSMSGYDDGGIALGINCDTTLGCESFDDIQIDPLP